MFGLVMAFQDFTPLKSFENSPWVGLQNFRDMLALPTFWSVVRNTLVISLSMLLYNPMVYESGDIIDTLVYRLGLVNHQWSLSAAVGLMKSVISFILVVLSYRVATKRFDYQVF